MKILILHENKSCALLFIFLFVFSLSETYGQQQDTTIIIGDSAFVTPKKEAIVEGKVTEAISGNPLQGVTVFVEKLNKGTVTDTNGYYHLYLIPGKYKLRFRFLGLRPVVKSIRVYSDGELNIEMVEQLLDLNEVIIEATGYDNILSPVIGIEQMSLSEIKELPTVLGGADVINTLKMLPGVSTVGEGAAGFNVRGGRVDQNLVLMDGVPILNASHVFGLFSVFNPDIAEEFSLYKGHIPARYGGRLSSVLDVDMRNGSYEKFGFTGGIGIAAGRLLVEGPIRKGQTSFLLGGRGSYSDWLLGLVRNQDIRNSSASFYDGNIKLSHRFSNNQRVDASLYRSHDEFRFSDQFGFAWDNRIYNVEWNSSFTQNFITNFSAAYGSYESSNFEPVGVDAFNLENGIKYYQLKETILFNPGDRHTFNGGIEWITYDSKTETLGPLGLQSAVEPDRVNKEKGRELSFYAGDDIKLTSNILLSLGLRYSIYQNTGPDRVFEYQESVPKSVETIADTTLFDKGGIIKTYSGFEPRISTRIRLGNSNSIKLSYNRTRQYIHLISNNISPTPSDFWQVSTKHIPPQTANNYSAGYFQNFDNDQWETSLELFYKDIDNLVEYRNFADLFLNDHLETELFSGNGRSYGIEFNITKTSGPWRGWVSYTYSRTEVKTDGESPEQNINTGDWFPSNFDQPHSISLSARRRLGERSTVAVNFTYHTGRPVTALESSFVEEHTSIPIFTARNDQRIPYYMRLDISFTIAENIWKNRTPNPDRRYKDSMTISFYNILSRDNTFSVFYKRPDNRSTLPLAHKLSVLGAIIPSVTYTFSF